MANDVARKDRIISHMNREHTRELSHLLRHYNRLSSSQAAKPSLRDISLETMHIRAGGLNHDVTFTPALKSWDDVRTRLVEMDATSRGALGISDVYVTEYRPPHGLGLAFFIGVVSYFCSAIALPWIVPGSLPWTILSKVFPGGPTWYIWLVRVIFVPVLTIHVVEAYFFDKLRMKKHGVERWSGLWWAWEISVFLEGVSAMWRVDEIVAEKRQKNNAKKSS